MEISNDGENWWHFNFPSKMKGHVHLLKVLASSSKSPNSEDYLLSHARGQSQINFPFRQYMNFKDLAPPFQ